ncbi:MAG: hypothetical protein L7S56_01060 [Candidatus Poseidonia sp.]|nr:hypothetical protein [Poseidonia sp.]
MQAEMLLPKKDEFEQRVEVIRSRIDALSKENRMAALLSKNFDQWLNASTMSPVKLTQDLDTNKDGRISGNEFSTLLVKMTGEEPPEWVISVIFSFVDADPTNGIPLADWYAFLAASGMDIPEGMFKQDLPLVATIVMEGTEFEAGSEMPFDVKFSEPPGSYQINLEIIGENGTTSPVESYTIQQDEMDQATFDAHVIVLEAAGNYLMTVLVGNESLSQVTFTLFAREEPEEEPLTDEIEDETMEVAGETEPPKEGFLGFLETIEATRLRSEAMDLITSSPVFAFKGTVISNNMTLLGQAEYRGGKTIHCRTEGQNIVQIRLQLSDETPKTGDTVHINIQAVDWSPGVRQLIVRRQ